MRNLININEILGKYFVGEELTEAELMELENYKSANNNEFIALKKTMTQTKTATADFNIDIEAAWKKVEDRLQDRQERAKVVPLRKILSVAASLLLLVGITTFAYQKFFTDNSLHFANNTLKETIIALPDGSHIKLAPNALLDFEEKDGQRIADLKGEAFFDVKHDNKTFIVNAGNLNIKVLGTSFTVNASKEDAETVRVATGRVLVASEKQSVTLTKGEGVTYNNGKLIEEKLNHAIDDKKVFVFENTPLETAIKEIEKEMDVRIEIGDGLKDNSITTKLYIDDPKEAVEELALLCNCKYDMVSPIHFRMHK